MAKPVSHIVRRPGRVAGEPDVEIPVAEDLATTPGIPLREVDVSFYSRVDPLESQNVEKGRRQGLGMVRLRPRRGRLH